jgi:hypothetical protein
VDSPETAEGSEINHGAGLKVTRNFAINRHPSRGVTSLSPSANRGDRFTPGILAGASDVRNGSVSFGARVVTQRGDRQHRSGPGLALNIQWRSNMFNKTKFGFGKFAVSFLTGTAAGILAGLIIAPKLSRKTQREISKGFDRVVDKVEEKVEDVAAKLRKVV